MANLELDVTRDKDGFIIKNPKRRLPGYVGQPPKAKKLAPWTIWIAVPKGAGRKAMQEAQTHIDYWLDPDVMVDVFSPGAPEAQEIVVGEPPLVSLKIDIPASRIRGVADALGVTGTVLFNNLVHQLDADMETWEERRDDRHDPIGRSGYEFSNPLRAKMVISMRGREGLNTIELGDYPDMKTAREGALAKSDALLKEMPIITVIEKLYIENLITGKEEELPRRNYKAFRWGFPILTRASNFLKGLRQSKATVKIESLEGMETVVINGQRCEIVYADHKTIGDSGGNWLAYPERGLRPWAIYLEKRLREPGNEQERDATLTHEAIEVAEMLDGRPYEIAHKIANDALKQLGLE